MTNYIRLNITTEGATETEFVKEVLDKHLRPFGIFCTPRNVKVGKGKRGGIGTYAKAKNDIQQWIKSEKTKDVRFTTMFDFYALPKDFPGYANAQKLVNPYHKVECIEKALTEDIKDDRFIPYIQLHEFEALLFSDLDAFLFMYEDKKQAVESLKNILSKSPYNGNPELINEKRETAPSHRIKNAIPAYDKTTGSLLADSITIKVIRSKCDHFNKWLTKLENLTNK